MARLYFHLRDGTDVLLDPEGVDIAEDQAAERALREACALIAYDAETGCIDLRLRIDVEDAAGRVVHSLRLADAVRIVQPD